MRFSTSCTLLITWHQQTGRMEHMQTIYMDYAAATPLDDQVKAAMEPYFADRFYNPSALYLASKSVAKDAETARAHIANLLGARPTEIIFTAGGTEANNLAVQGVMQHYPEANCIVSAIEHESVLEPANRYDRRVAPVKPDGRLDLEALEKLIDNKTVLVSIMYANNEIGTIEPIKEVSQLLAKKRVQRTDLPLYLHTDACQAANYLDLHVAVLGVDLMTLNGGKLYGPKQSGALYVKTGTRLTPQILGGGQERGLRSGTENMAHIVGFAAALTRAQAIRHDEAERLLLLRQQFLAQLTTAMPKTVINGSVNHRLPNNIHVTFPGRDNERLLMELDELGIMCATGSACTASNGVPSHVLKAIGLDDSEAQASLRFTLGRGTTENDIAVAAKTLAELTRQK